jgi:hypothetical protein
VVSQKFVDNVGRSPWTAADALVGPHRSTEEPDQGSGADEGVRPTAIYFADFLLRTRVGCRGHFENHVARTLVFAASRLFSTPGLL